MLKTKAIQEAGVNPTWNQTL
jgi:Ca2+-dependent lipid-binding protein